MKIKQIIITGTLLVSVVTFAQKDELKALKKIHNKDVPSATDLQDYKDVLSKLEPLAVEESDKVYYNYYKGILPEIEMATLGANPTSLQTAKILTPKVITDVAATYTATLDYEKKSGKKIFTDAINEDITSMKNALWQVVIALDGQKKNKELSEVLHAIYLLDKKDQDKLYLAANYAINAQDFENALVYLKELKEINFTGESMAYYATNKETKTEDSYADKAQRDLFVKAGSHEKPRDEKIPSKRPEITKNIALILFQLGRNEEAKAAFTEARKENPNDASLIVSEADVYLKLKDMESYKKLTTEALQMNPNDETLLFNLGVTCANANQDVDAEKYLTRAIELKPSFIEAYLSLSDLYLKPDAKIVEEMLKIKGSSDSEIKKFNVLKDQRLKIFNKAMPILEKAHQLKADNETVKSNLMSIYKFLELTDKVAALKAEN